MARRRPQSFQAWALGLIGTIITALILYYVRVAAIEHMGQRQIERAQATMQRLQEQQTQRASVQPPPTDPMQHQPDPYEVQVMKAATESQRKHDEAWEQYYKPARGCDNWQSDSHMVECQNHKLRAKREFEQKWAADEFDKLKG